MLFFSRIDILLYLLALVISLVVSGIMQYTNAKYSNIQNSKNISGKQVAERILEIEGIHDVRIVNSEAGILNDNYNPVNKVVTLSPDIYNGTSIASLSVAAHEIGHVIQHHKNNFFLRLRSSVVPIVGFSSQLIFPTLILGILTSIPMFFKITMVLLLAVLLFQVITLPVEIDASHRALVILKKNDFLNKNEIKGARKMLTAAAFTYIAAVASTLIQLLRIFLYTDDRR